MTELTPLAVSSAPLLRAILTVTDDWSAKYLAETSGKPAKNISRDLGRLEAAGLIVRTLGSDRPVLLQDAQDQLAMIDGQTPAPPPTDGFAEVDLDRIDQDSTLNPRKIFDDDELESLAASIRDKGVAQPILLRQGLEPGRYRIVAGERRFRASQKAGKATIPAMIRDLTDDQALEIATIENIQRVNLSPLEEARAFTAIIAARMKADPDLALKDAKAIIADAVRKTVRYVEQRMDLLVLPPILQVRLEADPETDAHLSLKAARAEVQRIRRIEAARKARILPPGQLLAIAELWDATQARGEALESYASTRFVPVGHRGLEEGEPLAALIARRFVSHKAGHRGDPRHFVCGLDHEFSMKDLEEQLPGFGGKARREVLHALRRRVLGDAVTDALKIGDYATWALNPEFATTPDPDLVDQAEAWAEQDRQIQARTFDYRAQQLARDEADAAEHAATQARTARDKGDYGRNLLAAVRNLEQVGEGLGPDAFTHAFAGVLSTFDIPGPYSLHLTEDGDSVELRDGQGVDTVSSAFAFEARRRLFALAMNFASGQPLNSGPDLETPWSKPPEILSANGLTRARFAHLVACELLDRHAPLAEDADDDDHKVWAAKVALADDMAEAGLAAYLAECDIAFGAEELDWSDEDALDLADRIRLEGLGQAADFVRDAPPAPAADSDDAPVAP